MAWASTAPRTCCRWPSPPRLRWDDQGPLRAALWKDPASRAILQALEAAVAKLPDHITGQRKSFTAWSRKVQFAAARPVKGGHAMVGFAVSPDADPRLAAARQERKLGRAAEGPDAADLAGSGRRLGRSPAEAGLGEIVIFLSREAGEGNRSPKSEWWRG